MTEENEVLGFELVDEMPTTRLSDILTSMESKKDSLAVVNLDAIIPPRDAGENIIRTLLYKLPATVKILSLRYNQFNQNSIEAIINFVQKNKHLEMLYIFGSGFDEKTRPRLEEAWKKELKNHRTDNMGFTFIRIPDDVYKAYQQQKEE
jgi:hypothetical protein